LYYTKVRPTSIEDATLVHHRLVEEILVSNAVDATRHVKAIKFFNTAASGILLLA
jgi:hypothetical protein